MIHALTSKPPPWLLFPLNSMVSPATIRYTHRHVFQCPSCLSPQTHAPWSPQVTVPIPHKLADIPNQSQPKLLNFYQNVEQVCHNKPTWWLSTTPCPWSWPTAECQQRCNHQLCYPLAESNHMCPVKTCTSAQTVPEQLYWFPIQ